MRRGTIGTERPIALAQEWAASQGAHTICAFGLVMSPKAFLPHGSSQKDHEPTFPSRLPAASPTTRRGLSQAPVADPSAQGHEATGNAPRTACGPGACR